jgi:hypothetical protein
VPSKRIRRPALDIDRWVRDAIAGFPWEHTDKVSYTWSITDRLQLDLTVDAGDERAGIGAVSPRPYSEETQETVAAHVDETMRALQALVEN